jgi:phospholipase C
MATDRRTFLQMLGAGAGAAALPDSIARALAIPARTRTGTIADVEHIVILMQENRSFDHYFGTMKGVRGFGDPRAVKLDSGKSVFHQPNGATDLLPFRADVASVGSTFVEDLAHNWSDTHQAWNHGKYDQWVPAKGTTTMSHMNRGDIPFHYALADAFTICDAYHCSLFGPTDPNRYHMWTGWVGNDGKGGGPVLNNAEAGYGWSTYPEKLQKAGITWKIYQDAGLGLDGPNYYGYTSDPYIGNYGDNSLLYFHQYQNAKPGNPLYDRARTGTDITASGTLFDTFINDIKTNNLPQVSWIVAPEAYCEHPNWTPNFGAWYTAQILDALTANPAVWSKTAFFLTYDENDGLFDHMVPPTPPESRAQGISTVDASLELFAGNADFEAGPIGLGVRVPMVVISPWSKGGFVCSEVFDHTSLIRFMEQRFAGTPGVTEPNITPWRRAVSGDLTAAFNFASPNAKLVPLPSTSAYKPKDDQRHPDFKPVPPTAQSVPKQEPGIRFARPVPYELHVQDVIDFVHGTFALTFNNTGKAAAVFQVRSGNIATGPWTYTVSPNKTVSDSWNLKADTLTAYDMSVYGPNGFFRAFKGSLAGTAHTKLRVAPIYETASESISVKITNEGTMTAEIVVTNVYSGEKVSAALLPGKSFTERWNQKATYGWYDLAIHVTGDAGFLHHLAGHIETGKDSATDPAIGGLGRAP